MANLYTIVTKKEATGLTLTQSETSAVIYHDIFDFPLSFPEIIKWKLAEKYSPANSDCQISQNSGYFFLEGKKGLIYKRLLRKRISDKKMTIAKKAAELFRFLPSVKMVALTGSLAMNNADDESDIDLLIVSRSGLLWLTRALIYTLMNIFIIPHRQAGQKQEKNKLCLNMWFDENDLVWPKKDRNIYTAHEVAQIKPLINKDLTYEKFLNLNRWILDYWPNSTKIRKLKPTKAISHPNIIERLCFWFQYEYMRNKISREIVSPTRAVFHPNNWGKIVTTSLKQKYGFLRT